MRRESRLTLVTILLSLGTVAVAVAVNMSTSQLPAWLQHRQSLAWGVLAVTSLTITGLHVWERRLARLPTSSTAYERDRMIDRMRVYWIDTVLQESLYAKGRISLHLKHQPSAVFRPFHVRLHVSDYAPRRIEPHAPMVQVFDEQDGALLILGAPGSGKTTLLLEIARDLLTRAASTPQHPIPVLFVLSSWDSSYSSLNTWMIDQLVDLYRVPKATAKTWVESQMIIPLLDGLDEVPVIDQYSCIQKVNDFRRAYGLLPIAVTSRIDDYEGLSVRLDLNAAVVIEPLTPPQVRRFIMQFGDSLRPFLEALVSDWSLARLFDTPLTLAIGIATYAEAPTTVMVRESHGSHERLFRRYVDSMLASRRSIKSRYDSRSTVAYLRWMAQALAATGDTVFQVSHLNRYATWRSTAWISVLALGLVIGIIYGSCVALVASKTAALIAGLAVALAVALQNAGQVEKLRPVASVSFSLPDRRRLKEITLQHVAIGSVFALLTVSVWVLAVVRGGYVGVFLWLFSLRFLFAGASRLRPEFRPLARVGLLVESLFAAWWIRYLCQGQWRIALWLALIFSIVAAVSGILDGAAKMELVWDWQETRGTLVSRSVKLATSMTILYLFAVTMLVGVVTPYVPINSRTLFAALIAMSGPTALIQFFARYGGLFYIHHCTVRITLLRLGLAPLHLEQFLEHASNLLLLRRIGTGRYMFLHKLLQDYFEREGMGSRHTA